MNLRLTRAFHKPSTQQLSLKNTILKQLTEKQFIMCAPNRRTTSECQPSQGPTHSNVRFIDIFATMRKFSILHMSSPNNLFIYEIFRQRRKIHSCSAWIDERRNFCIIFRHNLQSTQHGFFARSSHLSPRKSRQ